MSGRRGCAGSRAGLLKKRAEMREDVVEWVGAGLAEAAPGTFSAETA